MTGDCHVRFCERLGAKLPRPTNLWPLLSSEGTRGLSKENPSPVGAASSRAASAKSGRMGI